ncbi:tyrosine-type recombinase/integrase [Candidatus Enterococcus ferrettii]|uniref:Site-specific integrase n=1 Tax=Candidatus Enterococcus ferrettii TaxID=2815324 RepID=A0ABV0EN05_9ENTE|nr:site-specific integrase [Enterococcus sp. 665A]MBO1340015.1 site-specific integrase [Enterococcus sp. 665A]
MARRGENIYKRKDGRWEGRYIKGRKANGKIHYGYVYRRTFKKVREVLLKLKFNYQEIQANQGEYSGSVEDWLMYCIHQKKDQVKPSTLTTYQYKVEKYALPYIGEQPLRTLTKRTIQKWVEALEKSSLGSTTIHAVFKMIRRFLSQAFKEGYLKKDPCQEICLPAKVNKKVEPLTLQEQRKIEKVAAQEVNGAPVLLALQTGMRIGELAALQWQDIDFSANLIHVRHTYQRILTAGQGTELQLGRPKTRASERVIPLAGGVKKWLLSLKQEENQSFVFQVKEHPMEPRLITYHFKQICKKAGVQDCHFHKLRHTFATRLLEKQGTIAGISALLGHSSTQMTLDIYTGSDLTERRKMLNRLEMSWMI